MSWQPINTAPRTRHIRVAHELDSYSMKVDSICPTYGKWDPENQVWLCSNAFTCWDDMLRWSPTHWLPEDGGDQ